MNKKALSVLLIIIMVVCFGGALSYPIQYFFQKEGNEADIDALRNMRRSALENSAGPTRTMTAETQTVQADATVVVSSTSGPVSTGAAVVNSAAITPAPSPKASAADIPTVREPVVTVSGSAEPYSRATELSPVQTTEPTERPDEASEAPVAAITAGPENTLPATAAPAETAATAPEVTVTIVPAATATIAPAPTAAPVETDRRYREDGALPYASKESVELDPEQILPQYREIYEQNNDLVGWLYIPGTPIDYPVLQSEESDYYLRRDFYGEPNDNGQLIMDSACDPWTPSYNLVISGHNMKSGMMFGTLALYATKGYWSSHKTFTYDSLTREGTYVVFAAFYSADYDVDEEGFRYNADIQYRLDAEVWLEDVFENCEYDTGIDVEFGDEILTLTTCLYHRENGRFVVVARRVREGEVIK